MQLHGRYEPRFDTSRETPGRHDMAPTLDRTTDTRTALTTPGHTRPRARPALDEIVPVVHDALRLIARHHLARMHRSSSRDAGLVPTAAANEAYRKRADGLNANRTDRAHFLALAARVTKQRLVDRTKARALLQPSLGG